MAKESKAKKKRPTAEKRILQSQKRNAQNRIFKSQVKTAIRQFEEAAKQNSPSISDQLTQIYSLMDKGVQKGIFKLNKASRTKQRLTASATKAVK